MCIQFTSYAQVFSYIEMLQGGSFGNMLQDIPKFWKLVKDLYVKIRIYKYLSKNAIINMWTENVQSVPTQFQCILFSEATTRCIL